MMLLGTWTDVTTNSWPNLAKVNEYRLYRDYYFWLALAALYLAMGIV